MKWNTTEIFWCPVCNFPVLENSNTQAVCDNCDSGYTKIAIVEDVDNAPNKIDHYWIKSNNV